MNNLSVFLKKRMIERNLKSNQLAKLSGVSTSEISRILSGERKNPSPQILRMMSPILRIAFAELMDIAYPPKSTAKAKQEEMEPITKEVAEFAVREIISKYLPFKKDYIPIIDYAVTGRHQNNKLSKKTITKFIPSIENATFAVVVKGNDLLVKNIKDNDIAYIEQTEQVEDNEIVLIECEEQYFLRTFNKKENRFVDQNGNVLECEQLKILGKMIGLLRTL